MGCNCGPQVHLLTPTGGIKSGGSAAISTNFEITSGGCKLGGTSSVSTDKVFDAFSYVYHLHEEGDGTTGEYAEANGGSGGTAGASPYTPALVPGIFLFAQQFDGNDFIQLPPDTIDSLSDMTVSLWGKSTSDFLGRVFFTRGKTSVPDGWGWSLQLGYTNDRKPYATAQTIDGEGDWTPRTAQGSSALSKGCWYHLGLVWTSGNSLKLYVDGDLVATQNTTDSRLVFSNIENSVGRRDISQYLQGEVSEVRISSDAKSASWLMAEHDNFCGGLYEAGLEETATYE